MTHPEFSKQAFDFLLPLLPKRFAPAALTGENVFLWIGWPGGPADPQKHVKKEASRVAARYLAKAVLETFSKVWDES